MKKIVLPLILTIGVSLQAQIKNPYENLSDQKKLSAITNYLAQIHGQKIGEIN